MSPTPVSPVAESVLFVHAHPDDESLWTGGTIALLADAGAQVPVITCTWTTGTERNAELRQALAALGECVSVSLGYGDGGFPESAADAPPLCDAPFDEVVGAIVAEIRRHRPAAVVTYDACGVYGHPDHIHTHRLTLAAVEAAAAGFLFPGSGAAWQVRSLYLCTVPTSVMGSIGAGVIGDRVGPDQPLPGTPDEQIDLAVDVSAVVDRKWAAISAHRTELDRSKALRMLLALDDDRRTELLRTESYMRRDLVPGGADLVPR